MRRKLKRDVCLFGILAGAAIILGALLSIVECRPPPVDDCWEFGTETLILEWDGRNYEAIQWQAGGAQYSANTLDGKVVIRTSDDGTGVFYHGKDEYPGRYDPVSNEWQRDDR